MAAYRSRTLDVLDSLLTYKSMTVAELMEDIGTERRAAIDDAIDNLIEAGMVEKAELRLSRLDAGERGRKAQAFKLSTRFIAFDEAQKQYPHIVEHSGGRLVRAEA